MTDRKYTRQELLHMNNHIDLMVEKNDNSIVFDLIKEYPEFIPGTKQSKKAFKEFQSEYKSIQTSDKDLSELISQKNFEINSLDYDDIDDSNDISDSLNYGEHDNYQDYQTETDNSEKTSDSNKWFEKLKYKLKSITTSKSNNKKENKNTITTHETIPAPDFLLLQSLQIE